MSRRPAMVWIAAVTFAVASGGPNAAQATPPQAAVRDSAGVRVVSLPRSFPERDAAISVAERFSTLGVIDLYRVSDAVFLPDGRLAVANSGSHEVLLLDPAGKLLRRQGREGRGPGEFAGLRALGLTAGEILWAYDDRLGRLTAIPDAGEEVRTRSLTPADPVSALEPLVVDWDGPVLAIRGEHRVFRTSGESRDTVPLLLFDPGSGKADTLGRWPGREKAFTAVDGGAGQLQIGFGRNLYTGAHGSRAVLGSSDGLDLSVYDDRGRVTMKIVGRERAIPVPRDVVDAWRRDRMDGLSEHPEIAAAYSDVRVAETYPAFDGLAVDERGRIWIGLHPEAESTQVWWIIGHDGPEAAVALPSGGTVLAVAADRIALLDRTELGEEYVAVFTMDPEATEAP